MGYSAEGQRTIAAGEGRFCSSLNSYSWDRLERSYFNIFLRFNQTLPGHLRDGRGIFRDQVLLNPVYMAGAVSQFDTQYWTHRRELEALNQRIQSQGGNPTTDQTREQTLHRDQMGAAEQRIASALV